MNKIDERISMIKRQGRIGLMAHLVAGYPSLDKTESIACVMAEHGADFIELQMPFTDPLADGPSITEACSISLKNGTKTRDAMGLVRRISDRTGVPVLFMAYYNNAFRYGVREFCSDAKASGASGIIIPDMPVDEEPNEHLIENAVKLGLHAIRVVAPASTADRLRKNAVSAKGFVYCTARQGTTGARPGLGKGIVEYLDKVRGEFNIPVAVGFGISRREHVLAVKGHADIAVVGSAVINAINKGYGGSERNVGRLINELLGQR